MNLLEEILEAERGLRTTIRTRDLQVGDNVEMYGVVEWIELPPGPNALVDFVGHPRGTYVAKSVMHRVMRRV